MGLGFGRFGSLPESSRLRVLREKQAGPTVVVGVGEAWGRGDGGATSRAMRKGSWAVHGGGNN